jgi:alpha-L-fucosidase
VRTAKAAGQQYVVFTTKHHEGFALFDSAVSRHTAMHTPFRRDLCAELARACRRHDMKLGWYYSIMDWHHPDYLPRRDWEPRDATGADFGRYVAFMKAQLHELLTHYGDIAVLWFDGQWEHTWTHAAALELEAFCRRLMPGVVINDRIDVAVPAEAPAGYRRAGDYVTPELAIPERGLPGQDWEACMTMNSNWGYAKDDQAYKPAPVLLQLLAETASKGGNLLLNVGPTGRGEFDERALSRLQAIGEWMKRHSRSIYGCTQAPEEFKAPQDCRYTYNPDTKRLYLHVLAWPYKHIDLGAIGDRVAYAQLLNDASEVPMKVDAWYATHMKMAQKDLVLTLPQQKPNVAVPVIELYLK